MAPILTGQTALSCVSTALNGMPNSYLNAITSSLTLAITTMEALMAMLEMQILALNGVMTNLRAQKSAILNVVSAYSSQLNIMDMALVNQCAVLGEVNTTIAGMTRQFIAPLRAILDQIDCYNRIYLEYQQNKSLIQVQIDMLKSVRTQIQSIINLRSSVINTATITRNFPQLVGSGVPTV